MPRERRLYLGGVGALGTYRAERGRVCDVRPFTNPLLVFPRTTLRLRVERTREDRVIGPTSVLLHATGDVSHVSWIDSIDRCDFIVPSPELHETLFRREWGEPVAPHAVLAIDPRVALRVRQLVGQLIGAEAAGKTDGDSLAVEEQIVRIVECVADQVVTPAAGVRRHDHLLSDRVREVLSQDPVGPASLGDLARLVGASTGHLSRAFRRSTGLSVHQFRNATRVWRSLDELDDDLSAVAQRWGFASHSHYTSVFKHWCGVTPSEARRGFAAHSSTVNGPWWRAM